MGNKGRSDPNIFGGYNHYDNKGKKIGHSDRSFFGGYNDYDANNHKIGHTDPSIFGGYDHYDAKGHKVGHSDSSLLGGYNHYDAKGHKVGRSDPRAFGGYSNNSSSGGCYIATCVYGSYDCPEVWTLRRFRDYTLAESVAGRMFVRIYYTVSPTVVKLFGKGKLFRIVWRNILDKEVSNLHQKGYSDSPYNDINW